MGKTNRKPIQPLPFNWYYLPVIGLCLLGLGTSLYLGISHYRVYTDVGYRSFCAISKAVNCDTVSQSPYSVFLSLPLPVWGVFGYAAFLFLTVVAGLPKYRPRRLWRLCFIVAVVYSAFSVLLAVISSYWIGSYCILCIVTYGINFALTFYCWLIARRFDPDSAWRAIKADGVDLKRMPMWAVGTGGAILFLFLWIYAAIPEYWEYSQDFASGTLNKGMTEDGHPWIGAESPDLTIVEFADYQCFQCKKMHYHLRSLVARHPDQIRLVHLHYPMDHTVNPIVKEPFHSGSAAMAVLAIKAGYHGKFWEANDELFRMAGKSIDTAELAHRIGMDPAELGEAFNETEPYVHLLKDIRAGMKLGITGTPSFLIDGILYESHIPPDVFKNLKTLSAE